MMPSFKTLIAFLFLCGLALLSVCLSKTSAGLHLTFASSESSLFTLLHIRLPRTLLAIFAGASYALSGLVLQNYLRTPLADANLIGLGSFAALGSLIGLYLGLTNPLWLILLSCGFTLILPVFYFLFLRQNLSSSALILTGLCLTTFTQGLVSLLIYIIHQDFPLHEVLFWLFGSFSHHTLKDILLILPPLVLGVSLLISNRKKLDLLCLNDEMIFCSGLSLQRLGLTLIFGVALLVGPIIALTGVIGFVGIIAPHLVRLIWQQPPSRLVFPCILVGGTLTLLTDSVVRCLPLTYEMNVGILVALIATPVFIHLIWSHQSHD